MEKMLVIVFDEESKAYEGTKALRELHAEGSLTLYAAAVINKDAKGNINVRDTADQGAVGTALGLATGSLIGLLGGPLGVAIGASTGTMAGSLYDLAQLGIGADFLDEVSESLSPGKTAVVADVDEEWVTPLDTRIRALGGNVFRRARGEFIDAQVEQEMAANKAEIKALKAEYNQSTGQARANLQAKIDSAQQRLQSQRDKLKERIEAIKREIEAKTNVAQEQAAKAQGELKARIENRIAETRAAHEKRVDNLNEAWQLVKEAAAT